MKKDPCSSFKVEPLNPTHLAWFPQLQSVLLGDLAARIEQRFPDLLPSRSPRCVVGSDAEGPVAAAVSHPVNRRGSCWTLHWPQQLRASAQVSCRSVQRILLQAQPGNKVRFRQKADGPGERWMEGEAERVEYDDRSAMVKLMSKAKVRRTLDGVQTEEAEGEFISYDSRTEEFTLRNTSTGEDRPGGGRNTIVLQSKRKAPPAPALATMDKP